MRRLGTILDERLTALVDWLTPRVTERWGCVIPGVTATFVILLIPTAVWLPFWYAVIEIAVLTVAGIVGLAYIAQLRHDGQRRDLLNWTSDLRRLDAEEFEWLARELFEREGYDVEHTGSQHRADGNIDLVISRKSERVIVQCKRWTARFVGPDVVREFAGTHPARGDLTGRLLLTLSDFTDDARTAARRAGVDLVDGSELGLRLQAVRRSEPCEQCGAPMMLDRSIGGWWLRCPRFREGCAGKRNLSRDPGRAVDLLLAQPHQH